MEKLFIYWMEEVKRKFIIKLIILIYEKKCVKIKNRRVKIVSHSKRDRKGSFSWVILSMMASGSIANSIVKWTIWLEEVLAANDRSFSFIIYAYHPIFIQIILQSNEMRIKLWRNSPIGLLYESFAPLHSCMRVPSSSIMEIVNLTVCANFMQVLIALSKRCTWIVLG